MCNLYRIENGPDAIRRMFEGAGLTLTFPEGIPNFEPADVHITDHAPVVRWNGAQAELVVRRWSWPSRYGSPLFNMRSDGRNFPEDRCLVPMDGFYEYTQPPNPDRKRKKDRWLFRPSGTAAFAIAGLLRSHPETGEAFTLLTGPPGPDVEPYHNRQIVLLSPDQWRPWLDGSAPSADLLVPTSTSQLNVEAA
jgi:putative SOS response-associated peptidase YedK